MAYRLTVRRRLAVDRRQLLVLLVAAMMIGSFILLILWPKQQELSALGVAVGRERDMVKQKVRTSREGVYVTARMAALRKARGWLDRQIPEEPRLADFLEQVAQRVAAEPGVTHEVERADTESSDGTPAVPVRLRLVGPFESVYQCLADIEALERLIRFRRVHLSRTEGGVAVEIEILVYYLPPSEVQALGRDGTRAPEGVAA